jgi:hypothetical protein
MARSRLNDKAKMKYGDDDGTVLFSLTEASKLKPRLSFNSTQFANITDYVITANVLEGDNDGQGTMPTSYSPTATMITISVDNRKDVADSDGNAYVELYLDAEALLTAFTSSPAIDAPVYGFIGVTISEPSSTTNPQRWEILRGQVEIVQSATVST